MFSSIIDIMMNFFSCLIINYGIFVAYSVIDFYCLMNIRYGYKTTNKDGWKLKKLIKFSNKYRWMEAEKVNKIFHIENN